MLNPSWKKHHSDEIWTAGFISLTFWRSIGFRHPEQEVEANRVEIPLHFSEILFGILLAYTFICIKK
jgi:hypothetical protein